MTTTIFPLPGTRKSLQRGIGTCGTVVVIAPVDPAKAYLKVNGWCRGGLNPCEVNAILSSATTITSSGNDSNAAFSWEVKEEY